MNSPSIFDLPEETVLNILKFLSVGSLTKFSLTSKQSYRVCSDSWLWRDLLKERYPLFFAKGIDSKQLLCDFVKFKGGFVDWFKVKSIPTIEELEATKKKGLPEMRLKYFEMFTDKIPYFFVDPTKPLVIEKKRIKIGNIYIPQGVKFNPIKSGCDVTTNRSTVHLTKQKWMAELISYLNKGWTPLSPLVVNRGGLFKVKIPNWDFKLPQANMKRFFVGPRESFLPHIDLLISCELLIVKKV
jgi:hypothetical protein